MSVSNFPVCSRCYQPMDVPAVLCERCQEAARLAYAPLQDHVKLHNEVLDAQARAEAEQLRQERHHEVLCSVLAQLIGWMERCAPIGEMPGRFENIVKWSRLVADAAYPPPKEQG